MRKRIRYISTPGALTAVVEVRPSVFAAWRPTGERTTIDLARAARALAILDKRNGNTAGDGGYGDLSLGDTAGFGDRLKRFAKKVARNKVIRATVIKPAKFLHKVTHGKNSPIRKMEMQVQKFVAKALPITKPFINFHNNIAAPATYKALQKAGIAEEKRKLTAKGIAEATKHLPAAARKAAQAELVKRAKQYVVQAPSGATYRFNF